MIRWDEPIEAVHEDGRCESVVLTDERSPDRDGDYHTTGTFDGFCGLIDR